MDKQTRRINELEKELKEKIDFIELNAVDETGKKLRELSR